MQQFLSKLKHLDQIKGIISITAAVVMYFTPDYIDNIIELMLVSIGGLDVLKIEKK